MQLQSNLGVAFVNALNIGHVVDWIKISWACMVVPGKYMKIDASIGLYHYKKEEIIELIKNKIFSYIAIDLQSY